VGICKLDEYGAAEFLCSLGNQEEAELQFEAVGEEDLWLCEFGIGLLAAGVCLLGDRHRQDPYTAPRQQRRIKKRAVTQ
jgi:hypothetical protein